jgi:hypothetical protein
MRGRKRIFFLRISGLGFPSDFGFLVSDFIGLPGH